MSINRNARQPNLATGLVAGTAGGLAEILWVLLYARLQGTEAKPVAEAIAQTIAPGLATGSQAIVLGLSVHMALALTLGAALALACRSQGLRELGQVAEFAAITAALALVWGVNFLLILPWLNPDFVHIVPLSVSFASKMLFGIAAAAVVVRPRVSMALPI